MRLLPKGRKLGCHQDAITPLPPICLSGELGGEEPIQKADTHTQHTSPLRGADGRAPDALLAASQACSSFLILVAKCTLVPAPPAISFAGRLPACLPRSAGEAGQGAAAPTQGQDFSLG